MNVSVTRKGWRKRDCIDKLIQVTVKKVIKNIWSFYGLAILHFGAKNVIQCMQQLYFVAGVNIVLDLESKQIFRK